VSRFTSGTTPTSYRFTGQREEAALGLYFYNARWYDPALGHFLSPDALVPEPGNALDYHRYAYVRFNPLKYVDSSGHCPQPSGEFANSNIICVAGFIPTQTSSGLPGLVYFRGDDRDFSNASNPIVSQTSKPITGIEATSRKNPFYVYNSLSLKNAPVDMLGG
jgi:RHS repeat-associated protein